VSRASSEAVARAESKLAVETKDAVEAKPVASAKPAAVSKPAAEPVAAVARPAASGTLGEENHLLGAALSAERSGDRDRARVLFEALIAQNPSSPLAPEARTGLSRLR
jgi:TolA-binding protein